MLLGVCIGNLKRDLQNLRGFAMGRPMSGLESHRQYSNSFKMHRHMASFHSSRIARLRGRIANGGVQSLSNGRLRSEVTLPEHIQS
jgi:hypothetical protein